MPNDKKIETEVVLCEGEAEIFKEVLFSFSSPYPFYIEDVNVKLQNTELTVAKGKCDSVIFNGDLFINVIFKTIEGGALPGDGTVTVFGSMRHQTQIVPIGGCIDVDCEKLKKCDKDIYAKLVDICILENHILQNPSLTLAGIPVYSELREQVCIKIKAKVVSDEIVNINLDGKEDKCCEC